MLNSKLIISLFLLIFTIQATANSHCNNSQIIITNQSKQTLTIVEYAGHTGSKIKLSSKLTQLRPKQTAIFIVKPGRFSSGDALGKIILSGEKREFGIYYAFITSFLSNKCSGEHDVYINKYENIDESYKIDCDVKNAVPATIYCSINSQ